ncbi:hypothetical protein LEM8419_02591 [Neolewinella maritima]|uniref:Lipoprotein n=1 Tax=Neolewinella maritima TaxID=1383882 RepID=A0ABM9B3A4_9BACT|nr:hypothetical protein [Neolewinella maritima]CAH1001685.1 hypothetical protein LEM8419_02591 [Neolewinella maritima]
MKRFFPACVLALLLTACGDDDDQIPRLLCGPDITIGDVLVAREFDSFTLVDAKVTDLCLEVTVSATGCSSQGWTMELFTFGEVAESLPTQTSARLLFDDGVDAAEFTCQAEVTETYSFDLSPYLTPDALPTEFTLTGLATTLSIPD